MSKPSDSDPSNNKAECPVHSEWARHLLYVGGMVALHSGLGGVLHTSGKSSKCPVSETARHLVYVGGFIALSVKAGLAHAASKKKAIEDTPPKDDKCPVSEFYRHVIYVVGMFGIVGLMEARKK